VTAREVLNGIKERAAIPPESFNFIQQAAHENQLLKVDLPRLTRAVEAVLDRADRLSKSKQCEDREIAEHLTDAINKALAE